MTATEISAVDCAEKDTGPTTPPEVGPVSTILDDLRNDLTAAAANSPRSLQVATGASQLYGCRAEGIFRLRGEIPEQRLSWDAEVGSAIHERLATLLPTVRGNLLVEQKFVYKDVAATVDYIDLDRKLLIDWKTKDDAAGIHDLLATGPKPKWLAQVHLGAMAAREAGYDVQQVAIVVLPRSGSLDDAVVFGPYDVDESQALDAAEWAADVDTLARDTTVDPREFRDEPAFFCYAYCPFVKTCRGERPPEVDLNELAPVAEAYREAQDVRDAADERMKYLRPLIPPGTKGRAGATQVSCSTGSAKASEVEDVEALRANWRFIFGDDAALPTIPQVKTTGPRLTVKWAKEPK